jgi:hypothetical protein
LTAMVNTPLFRAAGREFFFSGIHKSDIRRLEEN